jgi:sulfur-oxidizing protein SoxZ
MANSIKIRSQRLDGITEIKLLISHPMENGRNRDLNGELIPAHFIEQLVLKLNGQVIFTCNLAGSVSKNPFFTIRLKTATTGDKITGSWTDNRQVSDSAEHVVS